MAAFLRLATFLIVCAGFGHSASAQEYSGSRAVQAAFGDCGSTCVIRGNPGGSVRIFMAAAEAVLGGAKRLVVIDGPCASACAIFADFAREKVCITSRASFRFHKASLVSVSTYEDGRRRVRLVGREDPPHSHDIALWVRSKGGFPIEGLRVMNSRQALAFWRQCSPSEGQRA